MDLNEMRDRVRKVKAPGIDAKLPDDRMVDGLIAAVKAEDARDMKRLRQSMIFFVAAGFFYGAVFLLTFIAPPHDSPNKHRMILALFAFVLLSIGIFSRMKSRRLAGVDYTEPSNAFLQAVEQRYRIVQVKELAFVVPYLLILVVTSAFAFLTGIERYFPSLDPEVGILLFAIFFVIVLALGLLFGWKEWKRRKAPLLDEIRAMRTDLGNGGR
jgi:drug/metabolite transporter (DMT)-like permease